MSSYRSAPLVQQPKISFVDRLMLSGSMPNKLLGSFLFFFVFIGMIIKDNRKGFATIIGAIVLLAANILIIHHYEWFIRGMNAPDQWFYSSLAGVFCSSVEGILGNGVYQSYRKSQQRHLEKLRARLDG